jgi:glycosyltransferase involved in cell wall biosynthesis
MVESGAAGRGNLRVMPPARRVARIITRLNIGGPSIQAIDLSRELRAVGFETCLIHGRLGAGEGDMLSLMTADGITMMHIDDLVRPISPLRDVRALWRIYRTLCRWRPEIVHTHMAKAGTLGRLAALAYNRTVGRRKPARLIHTYHGHVFEGYFGSRNTQFVLSVERRLARHTDVLIAISDQVRHDLLNTYRLAREEQVRVIPLGFKLDRLSRIDQTDRLRAKTTLDIPAGAIVITTVGRLTAIKQHSLFLEMAARVAERCDMAVFLVVGDGELKAELEAQVSTLGLGSRVRFLGWRGDLDCVYAATDVFVLTSRNEGTPVALIEAMASGVSSVSTDVGGVRDVLTDGALGALVPFDRTDELVGAVLRFAEAPALREKIGLVARAAVVHRFALRRLVDDISGLYDRLMDTRGAIDAPTVPHP